MKLFGVTDPKAQTYYSAFSEIRDVEITANVQAWIVFGCTFPSSKSYSIEFYRGAKKIVSTSVEGGVSSEISNTGTT